MSRPRLHTSSVQVLIVGAGPAGRTAAAILRRWGVQCKLIEKRPDTSDDSKAITVHAPVLELYEALGIADKFIAEGIPSWAMDYRFLGEDTVPQLNFRRLKRRYTRYPYVEVIPQSRTENILGDYLARHGCAIEFGTTLTDLVTGEGDYVTATLRGPDGGVEVVQAEWVLGCDGTRSSVRDLAGIGWKGDEYLSSLATTDGVLTGFPYPDDQIAYMISDRLVFIAKLPGEMYRIIVSPGSGRRTDLTHAGFQAALDEHFNGRVVLGECKVPHEFAIGEGIASDFRDSSERVLVLGDAAHRHTIFGGMGQNVGVLDAGNVAWKLAMVIQGYARPGLLDSYSKERMGAAKDAIGTARWIQGILMPREIPFVERAAMAASRNDEMVERVSMLSQTYRDVIAQPPGLAQMGGLALGDRVPDIPTAESNQRLYDKLPMTAYTVLGVQNEPVPHTAWTALANRIEHRFGSRVKFTVIAPREHAAFAPAGAIIADPAEIRALVGMAGTNSVCVVRPDRILEQCRPAADHDVLFAQLGAVLR